MYEGTAVVSDVPRQSSSVVVVVVHVYWLHAEFVSQQEVYDPAMTVHQLTVHSQSSPRRLQQGVFAHPQLLLSLTQHPLRQLLSLPAPRPLRQMTLLLLNPRVDGQRRRIVMAGGQKEAVTQ